MKVQNSPTYIGYNEKLGAWAFSPSPIEGVDKQWDASDWTWENVEYFMTGVPENDKENFLNWHAIEMEQ
jgi:hypothetical protein